MFSVSAQLFYLKLKETYAAEVTCRDFLTSKPESWGAPVCIPHIYAEMAFEVGLCQAQWLGMLTRQQLAALLCPEIWGKCLQHSSEGRARAGGSLQC